MFLVLTDHISLSVTDFAMFLSPWNQISMSWNACESQVFWSTGQISRSHRSFEVFPWLPAHLQINSDFAQIGLQSMWGWCAVHHFQAKTSTVKVTESFFVHFVMSAQCLFDWLVSYVFQIQPTRGWYVACHFQVIRSKSHWSLTFLPCSLRGSVLIWQIRIICDSNTIHWGDNVSCTVSRSKKSKIKVTWIDRI